MEPLADLLAEAGAVLADAAREDQRVDLAVEPHQVRTHVLAHPLRAATATAATPGSRRAVEGSHGREREMED